MFGWVLVQNKVSLTYVCVLILLLHKWGIIVSQMMTTKHDVGQATCRVLQERESWKNQHLSQFWYCSEVQDAGGRRWTIELFLFLKLIVHLQEVFSSSTVSSLSHESTVENSRNLLRRCHGTLLTTLSWPPTSLASSRCTRAISSSSGSS